MEAEELLRILKRAGELKKSLRHCWLEGERRESVADHSWRIALMAMLLTGEEDFASLDMDRVIRMCLIHDLGEAFTGDIPTFQKTQEDAQREEAIFEQWVSSFPEPQREEWRGLLLEMEEMKTREARTYKALDKLEALISHNESALDTWLPHEYDLQFTYGQEEVGFSPALRKLRGAVDEWTRRKILEEGEAVNRKVETGEKASPGETKEGEA